MERRILDQGPVSSEFVVVVGILGQDPAQMHFTQDHDMIQALSPDRADQPLRMAILPGRPRRRWSVPNAHGSKTPRYGMAIRGISVPNEVSGRLLPREGLGDLSSDPVGRRIGGDVDPDQVASLKPDDHQTMEQLEAGGRNDKQVDGADAWGMIAEKGLPSL